MKTLLRIFFLIAAVFSAQSQPAFINLDFEDAVAVQNNETYGWLDWDVAAPGWSHSPGTSTQWIYYQNEHLGMDQIFVLRDATSPNYAPGSQLAGDYSLSFRSRSEER